MRGEAALLALRAWLGAANRGVDAVGCAAAAADALAGDPWAVVTHAGRLARATLSFAEEDLHLGADLVPARPREDRVFVPEGAPYPRLDRGSRRGAGAFDTPAALARRVIALARAANTRPGDRVIDASCGAGAFLVALEEAGLSDTTGLELDPAAAAVAARAAPRAKVHLADGFNHDAEGFDLVVGNPPYVPPERQPAALRAALTRDYPWLRGRFDLAVPFAARCADRLAPGGGLALVLPSSLMSQPYARPLRARWAAAHEITAMIGPTRFPGATVWVHLLAMREGAGPAPLPPHGLPHAAWSTLPGLPWCADLAPGDPELAASIRACSLPLSALCQVDTGVVSHGPDGGKARLLHDQPAPGRVPYVDADDLLTGRRRWLDYAPARMHRPKSPALFASPKLLIQRLGCPIPRVTLDRDGLYAGHTLIVARPRDGRVSDQGLPLARLAELVGSRAIAGLLRLERGDRLDIYPHDIADLPVPRCWLDRPQTPLSVAWGIEPNQLLRLEALSPPAR